VYKLLFDPFFPEISPAEIGAYSIFQWRSDVNKIETTILTHGVTRSFTTCFEWGDGCGDNRGSSASEFSAYKGYASDVLGSIFAGES
jgi:hypothetical protein